MSSATNRLRITLLVGIFLRTIPIWFLVSYVRVLERPQNGSGVCPYQWVQKKIVQFRQRTQMRNFVLLNSWDIFLVTLPSIISLETSVIYSSIFLGTDVLRDWPFLGCSSCASLETAANFRLIFKVDIFWRKIAHQWWKLNYFCKFNGLESTTSWISSNK